MAVGHGSGWHISNIRCILLHNKSSHLPLTNVLHYPDISTNLLSVHQFSRDNRCYFVFTSDGFRVKYNNTGGKMLFHGSKSENELYHLSCSMQNKSSQPVIFHWRTSRFANLVSTVGTSCFSNLAALGIPIMLVSQRVAQR